MKEKEKKKERSPRRELQQGVFHKVTDYER